MEGKFDPYMCGPGGAEKRKRWKSVFLKHFWRGQEGHGDSREVCNWASRDGFGVEKVIFRFNMFRVDMQDCACYISGEYIFNKMRQTHWKSNADPPKIHRRSTEIGKPIENPMILHEHQRELKDKGCQGSCKQATRSKITSFSQGCWCPAWSTWSEQIGRQTNNRATGAETITKTGPIRVVPPSKSDNFDRKCCMLATYAAITFA